jgi:hypothetical protein
MGGRRISIQDPDRIVDDWPVTSPVGRERRKQEYRAQREALKAEKAAEPVPAGTVTREFKPGRPYPGYVAPEQMFPKWDWLMKPWGPPLDDPLVKAYCDTQRKAREKWERSQQRAN